MTDHPGATAPDDLDFAVAAYREDGAWSVRELTHHHVVDVETLAEALRRLPGDAGALAMVSVADDFFVLVRVVGASTRVLLSDAEAADDWDLAEVVLDYLDESGQDDADEVDDEGRYLPPGDRDLLADLGVSADDLVDLVNDDDDDLYVDEQLSELAGRIGFGAAFDDAVGLSPA